MASSIRTLAAAALALLAACAASAQSTAARRTEILWDRWGVPHLYGRTDVELMHAFGWAQAESHGDLILQLYGQARGRAAEYWGARQLPSDRVLRTMGVPGRAREWYAAQSPDEKRRLDAFAAGINDYARAHPDRIADEMERVLPVSAVDVLAHMQRVLFFEFLSHPAAVAEGLRPPPSEAGSNAWAVAPRRSASGHAMLLANPHLPWSGVYVWYEAQLAMPGMDAYGAALVGFPFLGIAFNDRLGWTHTVNTLDAADVYALTPAPGGYRWDGGVRAFETSTEVIRVRQEDGTFRDDSLAIRRSVHGPVLGERGGKVFAYRVAGLDAAHLFGQYWEMARARTLAQMETALGHLQMPMFTVMYADRDGHVMHLFNGRVPERPRGTWAYWSGTVPGDSSATLWTRTLPYAALPRVVDPPSGWLQNANDPPWTTTFPRALRPEAYPAYLAPRGMSYRAQRSARMLMGDSSVTFDELVAYQHDTRMESADHLLDALVAAARATGGDDAKRAADVLARWDRGTSAESRGGVLFRAWMDLMAERGRPIAAVAWSDSAPLVTPRGLADPAEAVAALDSAARAVRAAYGALDVPWGQVNRLRRDSVDLPASGGEDRLGVFHSVWLRQGRDGRYQAYGGDTFVAAVEFSNPVRARVLLVYGNSSQPGSPHRTDQLPLFARQEMRPVWRTRAEVEANLESRERF